MSAVTRAERDLYQQRFKTAVSWGAGLVAALERYDFTPGHMREIEAGVWLLRVHPPRADQERFGLAPEVLLMVVDGELLARHLRAAGDEVVSAGFRLDARLVIVADRPRAEHAAPLVERLRRLPGTEQRVAWACDGLRWPDLRVELARQLPTTDIFEEYDAVRGDQLMGRATELAELTSRVTRGDAVGVFGLRKVGKTSLVRGVTDRIDPLSGLRPGARVDLPEGDTLALWYDVGNLQTRTADAVADDLLSRLSARRRRAEGDLTPRSLTGLAALQRVVQTLLDEGKNLCLVLDEYDLLFEDEGGGGPVHGLNRLFSTVRAWSQQWQGQVSLVLIGRDPAHVLDADLGGRTNPLLAWFRPLWLGPLRPPGDRDMLNRLGRRVGLRLGPQTALVAREWTGGHPLILRQFGAAMHELARAQLGGGIGRVATDPLLPRAVDAFLAREMVLGVQREVIALLGRRYPDAHALLVRLSDDRAISADDGTASEPELLLRRFGLIDETTGKVPGFMREYVRRILPRGARLAS